MLARQPTDKRAKRAADRSPSHALQAPKFALEPPALVDYANATGASVACRPQMYAPTGTGAGRPQQQSGPATPTSVTWHRIGSGGAAEHPQDTSDARDSGDPRQLVVRSDGSLVVGAHRGSADDQLFRCCLSNAFGTLCSRPVRTRAGE